MNASRLLALVAGTVLSVPLAMASITNKPDHFFCDFASIDDFNQWTAVDVNGPRGPEEYPSNCWVYSWDFMSPQICCRFEDLDDWLFSPKVELTGDKQYVVKIKMWTDRVCQLQVTMGKDNKPESQTPLHEMEMLNGSYYRTYSLPASVAPGDYYFGLHATTTGLQDGYLFIQSLEAVEDRDGSIAFTLVNNDSGQALEDVELKLSGPTYLERAEKTDADGKATFTSLTPGRYSVRYDIPGLMNTDPVYVEVGDNAAVSHTLRACLPSLVSVGATVVDYLGKPVADADVTLESDIMTYSAKTASDGTFTLSDVYGDQDYRLTVSKFLKVDYTQSFRVSNQNMTLPAITLDNYFGKPAGIMTDRTENGMFVSWMVPLGDKEFKKDTGEYAGLYTTYSQEYVRYGMKFSEPMSVEEINWVVAEIEDGKVDLGVWLIDAEGNISTTPAVEVRDVASDTYKWDGNLNWQSYVLEEPVDAPYGCVVSVGHGFVEGSSIGICTDYVTCYDTVEAFGDPMSSGWNASVSYVGAFFIRAKGTMMSRNVNVASKAPAYKVSSRPVVSRAPVLLEGIGYNVWRIEGEDTGNPDSWTVVESDLRGAYTVDREFNSLPQGTYRYAVQAVNHKGEKTEIAFSAPVAHNLTTDYELTVYTNTAIELADGAVVTLKNEDHDDIVFTGTVAGNKVLFPAIPKGSYALTIEKYGFSTISTTVDLGSRSSYTAMMELSLTPLAPFALAVSQEEGSSDVVLAWNREDGIFDDFEAMDDFAVNPAGEIGWTYVDADQGKTYGVNMCQQTPYPNMHSPMAFQAFNPSATTPDITEYVQPYSGKKVLVSVSQENAQRNDDWIFSPEFAFDGPVTFRFHAASGFFGLMGNEEFMVGYTVGAPEPENVVWLTENPVAVGGMWTEFTYILPTDARHAVIRCVSEDCMFFMLDDIFIGQVEADVFAMTSFKIEIDGEDAGMISSRSIVLQDLDPGKHIARVQTVYTLANAKNQYSDFAEIVFNVAEYSGIDNVSAESLYVYDRVSRTLSAGADTVMMEVFDMQGRMVASGSGMIDLSGLAHGVLVVRVVTAGGGVTSARIVL